jgi:hypothetical protein
MEGEKWPKKKKKTRRPSGKNLDSGKNKKAAKQPLRNQPG